ncbi:MAG TPA: anthranilate phosphoribosyltransferase [Acidimicrobiales bacterium]|nr:anthranilate phosphoribosyltransferase [Acidimicrobiales bacterium]
MNLSEFQWSGVLGPLTSGEDLTSEQSAAAMSEILAGRATSAQIAGFIIALRMKGETVDEMAGMLTAMQDAAEVVPLADVAGVIDTCGTGGDRSHSINVSTIAALVVAGAGARVCKHGNRAASSACGSADVLEGLGVAIEIDPATVARCVDQAGIGFCFAARFHPCMRFAGPTRGELGVPTVFNFLGPLANPARVRRQVVGVSDKHMAEKMAAVLRARGTERALVVFGHDGLDEITTTTTSTVVELGEDGELRRYEIDPAAHGLSRAEPASLRGGDVEQNVASTRAVLDGQPGPHRDIVVLNAAAALMVAGLAGDLPDGLSTAAAAIDDGRAAEALATLVEVSNS